jgi:hypothetical protein
MAATRARSPSRGAPRYSRGPLPRERYLPGRGPRPACEPAGAAAEAARFDPRAWWRCEAFLRGVDLWNRGFYWEAHEAWEAPWRAAGRASAAGRLLQGLILLAGAALKRALGADLAARRLAARGSARLRASDAPQPGFDPLRFAAQVEAWVAGTAPEPPRLRLVRAPGRSAR